MSSVITPSNPVTALVDLSLSAVALCNEGANSRADIILHKRKEQKSMPKTFEELMTELSADAAALVNKHIETLRADDQTVIQNLQGEIKTLKTAAPAAQATTQEDVLKNASPEVRALVEKMQGQVAQLLAAQEEDMVEKRYQLCKAIPCEEATLRDVLKSASPATFDILKAAANAIAEGLHKATGSNASGSIVTGSADEAYATLEKSAKAIAAEQGVSFEKAFTEACQRDPDTYKKYVEGVR